MSKLNNSKTIIKNKENELSEISKKVKPIVNERMEMLNNVNYYMNIKHFYREYLFVFIIIFVGALCFANTLNKVIEIMIIVIFVYIIILIINYFVSKENVTKHIPEIIKENFEINQNTPIYIDEYNCVCQAPSKDNPFMNVLISDYEDNPFRPKACNPSNPEINKKIVDYFYSNPAFINTHDIYQTHNDMHQWYTQPDSTIPYDREGWMNEAYRDLDSCKNNQLYCKKYLWDLRRP